MKKIIVFLTVSLLFFSCEMFSAMETIIDATVATGEYIIRESEKEEAE